MPSTCSGPCRPPVPVAWRPVFSGRRNRWSPWFGIRGRHSWNSWTSLSEYADGRRQVLDNIYVERLCRGVKYENIYLRDYDAGPELEEGLRDYFHFYNQERLHRGLTCRTPAGVHRILEKGLTRGERPQGGGMAWAVARPTVVTGGEPWYNQPGSQPDSPGPWAGSSPCFYRLVVQRLGPASALRLAK